MSHGDSATLPLGDIMTKRNNETRQQRYRRTRARLDIQLAPAVLQRFQGLQGMEGRSYQERLVALMDCWERQNKDDYADIIEDLEAFGAILDSEDN